MKELIVVLLLIMFSGTAIADPKDVFDSQADKISHIFAGGLVAGLSYKKGADPAHMLLNALGVGIGKEMFDYRFKKKWDNWDIVATVAGGILFVVF